MSKITEFFKNFKLQQKFSKLGKGHRLDEENNSQSDPINAVGSSKETTVDRHINTQGIAPNMAAEAAISRSTCNQQRSVRSKLPVKSDVDKQQLRQHEHPEQSTQVVSKEEKPLDLTRVLFWCPKLFSDSVIGSREEVERAIQNYLESESKSNYLEASTLILIRGIEQSKLPLTSPTVPISDQPSLNQIREKRKQNIMRILENLIQNPDNPLYRRLRVGNPFINDLISISGAEVFLNACKFTKQLLPLTAPQKSETNSPNAENNILESSNEGETEVFYVISEEDALNKEHLEKMLHLLNSVDPILPQLYRDTKVFQITGQMPLMLSRDQLPDEFFCQTKEEIRRSLDIQQRIIEESGMLLTKAMRERLKTQGMKLFRYTVVRIRLPGDLILQGTFHSNDKILSVRLWLSDCFLEKLPFQLFAPPSLQTACRTKTPPTARIELNDDSATLIELGLAPSCLLILVFESEPSSSVHSILNPDLIRGVETL